MTIKLHGVIGSTTTFRTLAALVEKDLDFEFVPVDFSVKEQKTPEFLARNPFGQIPVYEDGDLTLFESRAITKYIAEAYADKGTNLISKDPKKSAIESMWMEVESQRFHPPSSKVFFELVLKPMRGQTDDIDEAVVIEFGKKLEDLLDVCEARLTKCKYLGGDSFSLVDLNYLPTMYYLMDTKAKSLFEARPRVSAWASDILSRPAWVKVSSMLNK